MYLSLQRRGSVLLHADESLSLCSSAFSVRMTRSVVGTVPVAGSLCPRSEERAQAATCRPTLQTGAVSQGALRAALVWGGRITQHVSCQQAGWPQDHPTVPSALLVPVPVSDDLQGRTGVKYCCI